MTHGSATCARQGKYPLRYQVLISLSSTVTAYGLSLWVFHERKTMKILLLLFTFAAGFSVALSQNGKTDTDPPTKVQVPNFENFPS